MSRFVIVQSKKDYDNEQYHQLRFVWWIIASGLFTYLFIYLFPSMDSFKMGLIFVVFMGLFITGDFGNNKVRSYCHMVLGFFFGIWALIFLIISTIKGFSNGWGNKVLSGYIVTLFFTYQSYEKLKTYTRLF